MVQNLSNPLDIVSLQVPNQILETLVCLTLNLNVKTALLIDVLWWQMPSTVIMTYLVDIQPRFI
jgi:hypothetical protein